jgi:5'-3' exonuclease
MVHGVWQVDVLLARVGEVEDEVFQRRKAAEDREIQRRNRGAQHQGRSRAQIDKAVANEGNAILEHLKRTRQSFGVAGRGDSGSGSGSGGDSKPAAENSKTASAKETAEKNKAAALALKNRLGTNKKADVTAVPGEEEQGDGTTIIGLKRGLSDSSEQSQISESSAAEVVKYQRIEEGVGGEEAASINDIAEEDDEGHADNQDEEDGGNEDDYDDDDDDGDVGDSSLAAATKKLAVAVAADVRKLSEGAGGDVADIVKGRLAAKQQAIIEGNKGIVEDRIRFHESGWKAR